MNTKKSFNSLQTLVSVGLFVIIISCLCGGGLYFYFSQQTATPTTNNSAVVIATETTSSSIPAGKPSEPVQQAATKPASPPEFSPTVTVDIIDVGQGDSILIHSLTDNLYALIDAGEDNSGALEFLQKENVKHLSFLLTTHPHADHIGGAADIIKNIPTDIVYYNQTATTATFKKLLLTMKETGTPLKKVQAGDTINFGSYSFAVLSPDSKPSNEVNNDSVVTRLAVQNISFLFMGDAQKQAEQEMMNRGMNVKSTIIKLGHHGSHTSSGKEFLQAVAPAEAVYSAGVNNKFGHPHQETLDTLNQLNIPYLGTDKSGTIEFQTDGKTFQIKEFGK